MSKGVSTPGTVYVYIDDLRIDERLRPLREEAVVALMDSIQKIGLQTPITIRWAPDDDGELQHTLVAGHHRVEACRRLGFNKVDGIVLEDERAARLWEISENLHRADLRPVERAEHIDEWRRLTLEKGRQVVDPPGGKQPADRGHTKTAETLNVSATTVRRAEQIAALPKDVRDRAREGGWSQVRLLKAREPVSTVPPATRSLHHAKAEEAQVQTLMNAWNGASSDARKRFLENVQPWTGLSHRDHR